jgi:3-hydroxyacyl-CoA dehydrogenase/enoyl-CoA hydratase/3-hydroxybutyryl-CoA epimerase
VTTTTTPPGDVAGVIEAVAEEPEIKRAVLDRARTASPDAWLATTSSSIALGELGADVGLLHFAYPAETGPVVEVSYPTTLASEALSGMRHLMSTIGKSAVEVRSVPGYVVSRILFAYLLEAVELVEAGTSPADVDAAAQRAGYMFGPLSMLDAAGIDLARHVARDVLEPAYGSRFSPPALFDRMVEAGDLGRGTSCGFFVYDPAGAEPNPALAVTPAVGETPDIETRLQLAVVAESVRLAEECVASSAAIDLLAIGCLRYPLGGCGPLAQLRNAGPSTLSAWNALSDSERLSLPPSLEETP